MEVFAGTDTTYRLAKKYKIKTAWGTDILFSPQLTRRHGALLTKLVQWYTPAEMLVMATGTNAELLAPCPASEILIRASSASSKKARWPICCSSTAIRSPTSS